MESCPVCAEDFQGLSKQKIHPHLKLHQEDVFCDKCGKNFPSASKLYQHYNTFHIKKAEVCCEQCGKSFSNEASLAKHKWNTHSAGVICESCDTKFSSKRNLMRHMKSAHEKTKNSGLFSCSLCQKSFSREDNLK